MSTFKVPVTLIKEILPHTNADRLEIAKVYDWSVVVGKGQYKPGDQVIYCPVDSVLPQKLEDFLFPPDAKIKLNKHRIKSVKIRGQISQGMIIDLTDAKTVCPLMSSPRLEADLSEVLDIKKYEPPVSELPQRMQVKKKKVGNPNFRKYTDIENFKYYGRTFVDGEQCYISEKLHGTSFRCGWFKTEANTIWKRVKKFFGKLPEWEFCYGSRSVEISAKASYKGFYGTDVYGKMVELHKLKEVIPVGRAVYGEIIGNGIQKDFSYGCKPDEYKLFVYDIMDTSEQRWLDYPQFARECNNMDLARVPVLYVGPWSKDTADGLRDGNSSVDTGTIREGVVIKPIPERKTGSLSRVVLKYISDAYYLKQANDENSTEFH